ncbi:hypothetical protein TRFO_28740 [Tritrichomonas foetus]|uniref:Uncharacterized protein n=1 Tax=Tritrichomonas foetus TaxID=1144522 RepID=A0A1J4JYY2_9EUKA|nr:hypothetical protein TRFO_28740 [Tritrichomonas foetus]|eukprot:OHT03898.1 hypothetical protein TRFO_28740 [Tritrichomonas foetus]
MKRKTLDFNGMVPSIIFSENVISEFLQCGRKQVVGQIVAIAKVIFKQPSTIEFQCNRTIDQNVEIAENEVPIYIDFVSPVSFDNEYIGVETFEEEFIRVMTDTDQLFNAYNIYSLYALATFSNNKLNMKFYLFNPKAVVEIEEEGKSNEQPRTVNAAYRISKQQKDPNSIHARFFGITKIDDARIFSLALSIYLLKRKPIIADFNLKSFRIGVTNEMNFDILTTSISVNKESSQIIRFLGKTPTKNDTQQTMNSDSKAENTNLQQFAVASEVISLIDDLKKQVSTLQQQIEEKDRIYQEKLDQHDSEIKELLNNILIEVKKRPVSVESNNASSIKSFPRKTLARRPVVLLEISESNSFENKSSISNYSIQSPRLSIEKSNNRNTTTTNNNNTMKAMGGQPDYPVNSNKGIGSFLDSEQISEQYLPKYSKTSNNANAIISSNEKSSLYEKRNVSSKDYANQAAQPKLSSTTRRTAQMSSTSTSTKHTTSNYGMMHTQQQQQVSITSKPPVNSKASIQYNPQMFQDPSLDFPLDSIRTSMTGAPKFTNTEKSFALGTEDMSIGSREFMKMIANPNV